MRWLMTLALLLLAACTTTVTPPPAPRFPVTVYVADYGRHASLLVPRPGGELVEFAYGEWKWFALGQNSMWRSPAALFWPTTATLGRRSLPGDLSDDELARLMGLGTVEGTALHPIEVEKGPTASLLLMLEERHLVNRTGRPTATNHGLTFAPDPSSFSLFYNCNSAVSDWLERLGCEVSLAAPKANYEIEPVPVRDW
ncbi:MAG: hypothetical protein ACYTCU_10245 [Planctomycetota bacterium]|jgi:hypothetical protein